MKNKPKFCKYCNPDIGLALNHEGMQYSGIEMRVLGYVGILRCRIFECADFEKKLYNARCREYQLLPNVREEI